MLYKDLLINWLSEQKTHSPITLYFIGKELANTLPIVNS